MPLESCMILLDCSPYMRNGDYIPTRLQAQQDAANMLVSAKTASHPESTVGISAGTELLVSPTTHVGQILGAVHESTVGHVTGDVSAAVSVASLALKHRRNKNGSQRIVLFCGTPVQTDDKALQKAGRQLKKNNVAIDVVAMGELDRNEAKLQLLVDAANGRDEEHASHLVTIPAGVLPSDVLVSSPVMAAAGGAFAASAASGGGSNDAGGGGGGGGAGFAEFGGVDPNMDPELAMALRVSMEEERARQERATAAEASTADEAAATDTATATSAAEASSVDAVMADEAGLSEEEALLQQALAMSMNETNDEAETAGDTTAAAATTTADAKPTAAHAMDLDEDEAMQMALQMSMANDDSATTPAATTTETIQDPAFVAELLKDMPGVDPNDPDIQEMLRAAAEKKKQEKK